MDVPPRDLICRPLAALKNNRAEAEERAAELSTVVTNGATNGVAALNYQPGRYATIDWVASRLHKAGAAVWVIIFNLDEVGLVELAMFAA